MLTLDTCLCACYMLDVNCGTALSCRWVLCLQESWTLYTCPTASRPLPNQRRVFEGIRCYCPAVKPELEQMNWFAMKRLTDFKFSLYSIMHVGTQAFEAPSMWTWITGVHGWIVLQRTKFLITSCRIDHDSLIPACCQWMFIPTSLGCAVTCSSLWGNFSLGVVNMLPFVAWELTEHELSSIRAAAMPSKVFSQH